MANSLTVSASGGSQINNTSGTASWSGTGNITASDDSRATVSLDGFTPISEYLKAVYSGMSALPSNGQTKGLEFNLEQSETGPACRDLTVRLNDGTTESENYGTNQTTNTELDSSDTVRVYGSPTDTWAGDISVSKLQEADWGTVVSFLRTSGTIQGRVDHCEVIVYYEVPAVKVFNNRMMRM